MKSALKSESMSEFLGTAAKVDGVLSLDQLKECLSYLLDHSTIDDLADTFVEVISLHGYRVTMTITKRK
jgi:hypothetical protein